MIFGGSGDKIGNLLEGSEGAQAAWLFINDVMNQGLLGEAGSLLAELRMENCGN